MVASQPTSSAGWNLSLKSLEHEILEPVPLALRGSVPKELAGTFYRIGPARNDVFGERFRHLFDGDGMIHAFTFRNGTVEYRCRFVQHKAHVEENRARKRLYGSFGTPLPGGRLRRFLYRHRRRNPANTNVLFHGGKLLALCEAGRPHVLDPKTLATLGEDDLGGLLDTPAKTFSAHPRLDPTSGTLWSFGVEYGRHTQLHLYRWPAAGRPERPASLQLPLPALIHDFALTQSKIVVIVSPLVLPTPPLGLLLGQRAFGESLRYRPELGTHIGIIDRESFAARWYKTESFLCFHLTNAYDQDGDVVAEACVYEDGRILDFFFEMMNGRIQTGSQKAGPERLRIRPDGTLTRTRISERYFDFPQVVPASVSMQHQASFGLSWDEPGDMPRRPAVLHSQTGKVDLAPRSETEWACECIPVPKTQARSESDAWLLTLVLDSQARCTELRVLDAADLSSPPVLSATLPHIVPATFHGCFVPDGFGSARA